MFTGLVEAVAEVIEARRSGEALRLTVRRPEAFEGVAIGDSIAVSGVCLTAVTVDPALHFDAVAETIGRSTLTALRAGDAVNLERSLAIGDRLGGHFVQGHVDGTATVAAIEPKGIWRFRTEPALTAMMIPKGSVTVDGISLTLVDVGRDSFTISLIPHTLATTTMGRRKAGDRVNIEADILGKWVRKLLGAQGVSTELTEDALKRFGFV